MPAVLPVLPLLNQDGHLERQHLTGGMLQQPLGLQLDGQVAKLLVIDRLQWSTQQLPGIALVFLQLPAQFFGQSVAEGAVDLVVYMLLDWWGKKEGRQVPAPDDLAARGRALRDGTAPLQYRTIRSGATRCCCST